MTHWKSWADMPDDNEWPPTRNAASEAEFDRAIARYERAVRGRIEWLSDRLAAMDRPERAEGHYVLATLYDRLSIDEATAIFRREVRWRLVRSVRLDPTNARAWALLAFRCSWIGLLGVSKGKLKGPIRVEVACGAKPVGWGSAAPAVRSGFSTRWARKAVRYIRRALDLDPGNATYLRWQRNFQCGCGPG